MLDFNPSEASSENSGIFGLPFSPGESNLVLVPAPWEGTTSYGKGTINGPTAILNASKQIDLYEAELGHFYEKGISMLEVDDVFVETAQEIKKISKQDHDSFIQKINNLSHSIEEKLYFVVQKLIQEGKIVGLVGGEHSTAYGSIMAHMETYPNMGILQIDAHMDLRKAFNGYQSSHASVMYNVIENLKPNKLVQVGIRDFAQEELFFANSNKEIRVFLEKDFRQQIFCGRKNWARICKEIVRELPKEVYVTFDIDGLDPSLCPNTGTPVPGGLSFCEARFLIREISKSGRRIVGFDLCEVSPNTQNEWDANVGSRVLFFLIGWTLESTKMKC